MVVTDKMSIHLTSVIETLYQILHFLKKKKKKYITNNGSHDNVFNFIHSKYMSLLLVFS